MNPVKRLIYRSYVGAVKAYQKLFLKVHVWGRENIPTGPKILVSNHITSTDGGRLCALLDELLHMVNGPGYNFWITARLLDAFEQINALPAHRKTVVARAVEYLKRGETVYITPEGDIQEPFRLARFYPGAAKMYRQIRVPIVPIALVAPRRALKELPFQITVDGRVYPIVTVLRGPFLINIGEPLLPDCPDGTDQEQDDYIMGIIRRRIESLVDDARLNKFWLQTGRACAKRDPR